MKRAIFLLFVLVSAFSLLSCKNKSVKTEKKDETKQEKQIIPKENIRTIYLAGGCFWGVEAYFDKINGVVDTESGYANGKTETTRYQEIDRTDHAEAVKVDYDISRVSLDEILLHYFRIIDPTSVNRQGNDIGRQYRTGIYYTHESQKPIIDKIIQYQTEKHGNIAVEVEELKNYVAAEDYHQDYLEKNPRGYCHIDLNLADEPLMDEDYKIIDENELKNKLDSESYDVIVKSGTERPFSSSLNDEHRKGIYVDKVTGEPLFSSKDKFDSGSGWPSFTKPILSDKISEFEDGSMAMQRIEVRSKISDAHLGHVFNDGPKEDGGLRYCINGAALEFIPYEDMKEKGYEEYMVLLD